MPPTVAKKNISVQWTNGITVLRDMPTKRIMPISSIMRLSKDDLFPQGTEGSGFNFEIVGTGIFMINAGRDKASKRDEVLLYEINLRCDHNLTGMVDITFKVPEKQVGKSDVLFFRYEQGSGKKAGLAKNGTHGEGLGLQLSIGTEDLETCRLPGDGEKFAYDVKLDRFVIVKDVSEQQLELLPFSQITDPFKQVSISYFMLGLKEDGKWADKIFPQPIMYTSYFPLVDAKL